MVATAGRSMTTIRRVCIVALLMPGAAIAAAVTTTSSVSAAGVSTDVLAWGDNSESELGDGTSGGSSDTPVMVSLPSGVTATAIAASGGGGDPQSSDWAAYAIGSDGNLYAWGDNSEGELGDGTSGGSSDTPVVVSLPSGVTATAVSAAQGTGYAIGSNGKVYAWGDNTYGKLGSGTAVATSDLPVVVSLPSGVTATAIAGGYDTAYAIGSDGTLYAWGDNYYGELGNGDSPTDSSTPEAVSLPSGVTATAIAGGGGCAYAIGSDGNLYAWGYNSTGQLGDGSTDNRPAPEVISLAPGVDAKAVTGGGGFAHAIGSDGKLYGWGLGSSGQVGVGDGTLSPVVVPLAPGVTPRAISDNLHTGYALGSDGNIYAWGYGLQGELGDGSTADGSLPVVVALPSGSTVKSLAPEPGSSAGFAIVSVANSAPSITTQPADQAVFATQSATFTAAASGFPTPPVQWQVSTDGGATFSPLGGATSDTLTLDDVTASENGDEYEAVFTNVAGSSTTQPATLTVNAPVAPTITSEPTDQTDTPGEVGTFSAAASGSPDPAVQWQVSEDAGATWSDIMGNSTSNSTTLSGYIFGTFENGWEVRAIFSNSAGTATTNAATLTVP